MNSEVLKWNFCLILKTLDPLIGLFKEWDDLDLGFRCCSIKEITGEAS